MIVAVPLVTVLSCSMILVVVRITLPKVNGLVPTPMPWNLIVASLYGPPFGPALPLSLVTWP